MLQEKSFSQCHYHNDYAMQLVKDFLRNKLFAGKDLDQHTRNSLLISWLYGVKRHFIDVWQTLHHPTYSLISLEQSLLWHGSHSHLITLHLISQIWFLVHILRQNSSALGECFKFYSSCLIKKVMSQWYPFLIYTMWF